MNRISQFRYAMINALHIYRRPAIFLAFLQTVEPMSITVCQVIIDIHDLLADTNNLSSESPNVK